MSKAARLDSPPPRQPIQFKLLPGSFRREGRPCPPPWDAASDPMPCTTARNLADDVVSVQVKFCLN